MYPWGQQRSAAAWGCVPASWAGAGAGLQRSWGWGSLLAGAGWACWAGLGGEQAQPFCHGAREACLHLSMPEGRVGCLTNRCHFIQTNLGSVCYSACDLYRPFEYYKIKNVF